VISRILSSTKRLSHFPDSGQEEETLKELNRGYRYLVSGNYKIVYRSEGKVVIVAAVFDNPPRPGTTEKNCAILTISTWT